MRNPGAAIAAVFTGIGLFAAGTSLTSALRADQAEGKALFEKRCGGCHALDRDKEGPRLGGVYGRTAGSVDSFAYSEALKSSKIVWSEDTLDRWLTDTERLVPKNDMTFQVQNPGERKEIIAFLKASSVK